MCTPLSEVVELRGSIGVGAGSLSFEMVRALVERLTVMICPRWVDTHIQPVAIDAGLGGAGAPAGAVRL